MPRLDDRVTKLEGVRGRNKGVPEAVVVYDGPHDPNAVVRAVGLQHLKTVVIEVIPAEGATNEPRLVGSPYYLPDCPWVLSDEQHELRRWGWSRPEDHKRRWSIMWGFGDGGGGFLVDSDNFFTPFKRKAA